MELTLYQIDAFTSDVFSGNPAAVVPLKSWLDDKVLQCIALENNLSETAFIVPNLNGYEIRWFTPLSEIELCGHATLASAFVIFSLDDYNSQVVQFESRYSGLLTVTRHEDFFSMNFPKLTFSATSAPKNLITGLGAKPKAVFQGVDYLAVYDSYEDVLSIDPEHYALQKLDRRGVIVTSLAPPESPADFVSRFFCPKFGVPEDPVCGSAHCMLVPYWASEINKSNFLAHQVSKRGGEVYCKLIDDRVELKGKAVRYLKGQINF